MALTTRDLIYPIGDLLPKLFPDGDIEANVSAWLAEADEKTSSVEAQRHWIYYRAYHAVFLRIASTPTTENSFERNSTTWASDRPAFFQEQAQAHLAEYNRLTGESVMTGKKPAVFRVH